MKTWFIGEILFIALLTTGCLNNRTVSSEDGLLLSVPSGSYYETAWVTEEQIAFLFSTDSIRENARPMVYDLSSEDFVSTPVPETKGCSEFLFTQLENLPNGMLGFITKCSSERQGSIIRQYTLYGWESSTQNMEILQNYPENFWAGPYTFNTNMSMLFQEEPVGNGLNNQLFRLSPNLEPERVLSDFQRIRSPAWSPDGKRIAFLGTKEKTDVTFFSEIQGLYEHPWDLYLMDPDGNNIDLVFSDIKYAYDLNWLPTSMVLSFTGEYKGKDGIWIFNPSTHQIVRMWEYSAPYDWSPDGTRMVVIANDVVGQSFPHPVIVEVPDDFLEQKP